MATEAPAAPTIVKGPTVKSGLPNGSGVVNVTPAGTDTGPAPAYKAGSARAKMFDALQQKAINREFGVPDKKPDAPRPAAIAPHDPENPEPEPAPEAPEFGERPGEQAAPPETPSGTPETTPAAPAEAKKQKANPWKLFEAEKQARAKVEKEMQDLKGSILPEAERNQMSARLEKAEKRAQELEQHMQYLDYTKSEEFQTKYQKPYEESWTRAMKELRELTVDDPSTGGIRPISAEDMLQLVNMPLPQAIETSQNMFGHAADYVMQQRNEIRKVFEAQNGALEEAKKHGSEHQAKNQQEMMKWHQDTANQIKGAWEKANQTALKHPEAGAFFQPREGDQEWNQRLAKGFQLVDHAYAQNPMDPKLSKEERAAVVERHAAVRNRAASWGPLKFENAKLRTKLDALEKELKGYKDSGPPAGGAVQGQAGAPASARARMFQDLQKLATH